MPDPRRDQAPPQETEFTGREFLEAQETKTPASLEELREATDQAFSKVQQEFGKTDSLEEWLDVTDDLDEAFLVEADGILGMKLMELVALDDESLSARRFEAEQLIKQTASASMRLYPLIHRLQTIGFAPTRAEVVNKISAGELTEQVKVNNVSITPTRESLIGLLRHLDSRLGTNVWSLEYPPELPTTVIVSNPFNEADPEIAKYWGQQIAAKRKIEPEEKHGVFSTSHDKTIGVIWELENIAEHQNDTNLKQACVAVVNFLNHKAIYYQDPDPLDFENYNLGHEQPEVLMELFRSLDIIKHQDPELFLELVGINPEDGGRSPYFGSFLHKAIYNTQKVVEATGPKLGESMIRTMLEQLLTLDEHVKTYAGIVSQESLKAMSSEMRKQVESAPTATAKAQALLMMMAPYTQMAIDAEVRRQFSELREASSENIVAELQRHKEDVEHPLKMMSYVGGLPDSAKNNLEIQKELRQIFGPRPGRDGFVFPNDFFKVRKGCFAQKGDPVRVLYERIPLIDESLEDLGLGLRIKIAVRDAVQMNSLYQQVVKGTYAPRMLGAEFLESAIYGNGPYLEDFELLKNQLTTKERLIGQRMIAEDHTTRLAVYEARPNNDAFPTNILENRSKMDWPFYIRQMLIDPENNNLLPSQSGYGLNKHKQLLRIAKENSPDLVFLALVADPKGVDVALANFDKFCDMIPPERMVAILKDTFNNVKHPAIEKLIEKFWERVIQLPDNIKTWFHYMRRVIDSSLENDVRADIIIKFYKEVNQAIIQKKTPWTFGPDNNLIDLWALTVKGYISEGVSDINQAQELSRIFIGNLEITDEVKLEINALLKRGYQFPSLKKLGDKVILTFKIRNYTKDNIGATSLSSPEIKQGFVTIKIKPTETSE